MPEAVRNASVQHHRSDAILRRSHLALGDGVQLRSSRRGPVQFDPFSGTETLVESFVDEFSSSIGVQALHFESSLSLCVPHHLNDSLGSLILRGDVLEPRMSAMGIRRSQAILHTLALITMQLHLESIHVQSLTVIVAF